jgi:hypothetical protein
VSTVLALPEGRRDWLKTVRAAGFKVCPQDAVECPSCGYVWRRRTFTSGHSVEVCPSNRRETGRFVHCNTHVFLLRIATDAGPRVLAIALENARAKDQLLSILEPGAHHAAEQEAKVGV